mmetsp:Transcript_28683/g.52236  ORF Transcript_28683/g.52236 Transcript_28683/m.52236 type:complete len:214 (-) Transcript_28683:750-1391(-)
MVTPSRTRSVMAVMPRTNITVLECEVPPSSSPSTSSSAMVLVLVEVLLEVVVWNTVVVVVECEKGPPPTPGSVVVDSVLPKSDVSVVKELDVDVLKSKVVLTNVPGTSISTSGSASSTSTSSLKTAKPATTTKAIKAAATILAAQSKAHRRWLMRFCIRISFFSAASISSSNLCTSLAVFLTAKRSPNAFKRKRKIRASSSRKPPTLSTFFQM